MTTLENLVQKMYDHQKGHRYAKLTHAAMLKHKQEMVDLNPGLTLDLSYFNEQLTKLTAEQAHHLNEFNTTKEAIRELVRMIQITS